MDKKEYAKKVVEAKEIMSLLRLTNKHRVRVAEIANDVCIILHGGRAPTTRYTLKRFAEDIGINRHTLYEWTRHKKYIFDKLTPKQKEEYYTISGNSIKEIFTGLTEKSLPKHVQQKFKSVKDTGGPDAKLKKYIGHIQGLLFNVSNHSRLKGVSDDVLKRALEQSRLTQEYILVELSARKSKVDKTILQPKIDKRKFWQDEIGIQ